MLLYVLIGLCLTLAGVAGLQMTFMFYLDRIDKERKKRLHEVERKCSKLIARLEAAEKRIEEQDAIIDTLYAETNGDEPWADVLDER